MNNAFWYMYETALKKFMRTHFDVGLRADRDPKDKTVKFTMDRSGFKVNKVVNDESLNYFEVETFISLFNAMYRDLCSRNYNDINIWHSPYHHNFFKLPDFSIKKVIFYDKATIVYWEDGTKTVVKLQGLEWYDPEKGLAMAIAKKALGNKGNYYEVFKKWVPDTTKDNRENSSDSIEKEEEDMTRTMRMNVVSLYNEGKLTHEIAEICNLTESEVVRILENEGVLR